MERCWQKINGPEDEAIVDKQTRQVIDHLDVVLQGVAVVQNPFTLAVYSALLTKAASTFALASAECHNSDQHIAEHLDKDIALFRARVLSEVERFRLKQHPGVGHREH